MRIVEKVERIGLGNIMATGSGLSGIPLQGGIYTRRNLSSPMAQLTSLKGAISSSTSSERLSEDHPHVNAPKPSSNKPPLPPTALKPIQEPPVEPGSGALDYRLQQLQARQKQRRQGGGFTRPDLGTVSSSAPPIQKQEQQSTFGTISSMLFGRKGGLL